MFKKFLFLIFLLIALCTSGFYFYLKYSVPPKNLTLKLKGLSEPVEVLWDKWGTPHINAQNEEDATLALGYIIASERLFQLDIYRRLGTGELSEIFGERTLKMDKLARVLRFSATAEERLTKTPENPEVTKKIKLFLKGVNQFVEEGPTPIEAVILGYKPRPFTLIDSYAFLGFMSFRFSQAFTQDRFLSSVKDTLSPEQLELLRIEPGKVQKKVFGKMLKGIEKDIKTLYDLYDEEFPSFDGSNAWAISSSRSSSGSPVLASDPHLTLSQPGLWFEAHINTPEFKIYGHYLPLVPFAVMGHNDFYAWALTIGYTDDMDFYRERLNENGTMAWYKNEWDSIYKYEEVINVKDKDSVNLEVRIGPHGPFLDDIIDEKNLTLKWTYYHPENFAMESFYKMERSKNVLDFVKAIPLAAAPGLNIVYADVEDNIAWWMFGKVPLRPSTTRSDFILNGGLGHDEYLGYIPFQNMPSLFNPNSGVIVSANSTPPGKSQELKGYWKASDRFESIHKVLGAKNKWQAEDFKIIQTSSINVINNDMKKILLDSVQNKKLSTNAARVVAELREWDQLSGVDSVGATIFHQWNHEALKLLIDEFSPKDRESFCGFDASWQLYKKLLKKPSNIWWNKLSSEGVQTRDQILTEAFDLMLLKLRESLGPKVSEWKWGRHHQMSFSHPLAKGKFGKMLFGLEGIPVSGGWNQINNMRQTDCKNGFNVKSGPSLRRIIDFSEPENAQGVMSLGNSGHLLSKNYKDQLPLFTKGQYRKFYLDMKEVKQVSKRTWNFHP